MEVKKGIPIYRVISKDLVVCYWKAFIVDCYD